MDDEFDVWNEEALEKPVVTESRYACLDASDIEARQESVVLDVASVLALSEDEASRVLRYFSWDSTRAKEAWFSDENDVRKLTGVLVCGVDHSTLKCNICFDDFQAADMRTAACAAHPFCTECLSGFVESAIKDGPGCLTLKCPEPGCKAALLDGMAMSLVQPKLAATYKEFLFRSFVERARYIKWCPAPGCHLAIQMEDLNGDLRVICLCKHIFCWGCLEESHRPIDCDTVLKWKKKNMDQGENTTWILAYTKPCPKCKRNIEKDIGCMHITCGAPCGHEFCWTCLKDWRDHKPCNNYSNFSQSRVDGTKQMWSARKEMERYTHYFERWNANLKSRDKSKNYLKELKEGKLEQMEKENSLVLSFILDAWEEIVRCREILTWSYVYGYYLDPNEDAKKVFFEYSQGVAEETLDHLHQCAESSGEVFARNMDCTKFFNFKLKLLSLTATAATYFDKLAESLEGGLEEVRCKKYSESNEQETVFEDFLRADDYHGLDVQMTQAMDAKLNALRYPQNRR